MSVEKLEIPVKIFDKPEIQPVTGEFLVSYTCSDIMKYIEEKLTGKMPPPPKHYVMMIEIIAVEGTGKARKIIKKYRLLDGEHNSLKNFARYKALGVKLAIVFYPPDVFLNVHRPGIKEPQTYRFDSKFPVSKIVHVLCQKFELSEGSEIAYGLYTTDSTASEPIPMNKAIIEFDPAIKDVYLLRRFWTRESMKSENVNDMNFHYSQAREMIFKSASDEGWDTVLLKRIIAIGLTINYGTADNMTDITKKYKKKKDLAAYFPYYWSGKSDKKKKIRKEIIANMKEFESVQDKVQLKVMFLNECSKNAFFGASEFEVTCVIPGGQKEESCILALSEDGLTLLEKETRNTRFAVSGSFVVKWKAIDAGHVRFHYLKKLDNKKDLTELNIFCKNVLPIVDHFTLLLNLLKQQKLLKQKGTKSKAAITTPTPTADLTLTTTMSTYKGDKGLGVPSMFTADVLTSVKPLSVKRIEEPKPQAVETFDPHAMHVERGALDMMKEFADELDDNEYGYVLPDVPEYQLRDDLSERACLLIKESFTKDIPLQSLGSFIKKNLTHDPVFETNIAEIIEQANDPDMEIMRQIRVACVAMSLEYLMHHELPPLDCFAAQHYIQTRVHQYARHERKDINFMAYTGYVADTLGSVIGSALSIIKVNHPMSTLLYELFSDGAPELRPLLLVNETASLGLMFCCISIAQACCDAGIGEKELRPYLADLPAVPVYDPILAYHLSSTLLPIVTEIANNPDYQAKLMVQQHCTPVTISAIVECVTETYNYCKFMQSHIAVYIQSNFSRLLARPEKLPDSIVEAGGLFQTARQTAMLLWQIDADVNGALALEISELAGTFYALYLSTYTDAMLKPSLVYTFNRLAAALSEASAVLIDSQDLKKVLNPAEVTQEVILSLLTKSGDIETCASLLTIESMTDKQKRDFVSHGGAKIDEKLRSINDSVSDKDRRAYSDIFRMFSMGVLYITKNEEASEVREKAAAIGKKLMTVMTDKSLSFDDRRDLCNELINEIRPLVSLAEAGDKAIEKFVKHDASSESPATYEVGFDMKVPDLTDTCSALRKLAEVLKKFQLDE